MQQIINEYIDQGFSLCAIPPNTKGPRSPGWNTREHALTGTSELPDGYGLGLCHAYSGTCALDIDSMAIASELLKSSGVDLETLLNTPDAVKVNSGRVGRGKLIYRLPAFLPPMLTKKFVLDGQTIYELRCASANGLTVQDCLFPTYHPDTGKQYTWEGDWKNIPTIPAELLKHWNAIIESDLRPDISTGESGDMAIVSWDEIESALNSLSPDCDRKTWITLGMAVHWAGAQTGQLDKAFAIWDSWSARSDKYKPGEMRSQWRSFKSDHASGVKLGSLFHLAKEAGWVRVRPMLDASGLFQANRSKAGLLARLDESVDIGPLPTIIEDYIESNSTVMVWGEPGSYKSFIVTDWMLSVNAGLPWCDKKTVKGSVWYLAGEGHGGIRQRVAAWRKNRRYDGTLDFLYSTKAIALDAESGEVSDGLQELLSMVRAGQVPSMVVVDTLARSMVGDENSTKDASRFIAATDELIAAIRSTGSDCCVVLVHHSRKDGGAYRGSSAFRGAIDIEFEVSRLNNLGALVTAHKRKDGELPKPIQLSGKVVSLGVSINNHGNQCEVTSLVFDQAFVENHKRTFIDEVRANADAIVRVLKRDYPNNAATKSQLMASIRNEGIKFRNVDFSAWLDTLEELGFIHIAKSKGAWIISPVDLNEVIDSRTWESLPPFMTQVGHCEPQIDPFPKSIPNPIPLERESVEPGCFGSKTQKTMARVR